MSLSDGAVRRLVDTALFDHHWWSAQTETAFAGRPEAAHHYLTRHHEHASATPHPLVSPVWMAPREAHSVEGDPISTYLDSARRHRRTTHPLLSLERIREVSPAAATDPRGPVEHWLRTATPQSQVPVPRGVPPVSLQELVSVLAHSRPPGARAPVAGSANGSISLVMTQGSAPRLCSWVIGCAREHPTLDLELIVTSPLRAMSLRLVTDVAAVMQRVRILPAPDGSSTAERLSRGLAAASGEVVVLMSELPRVPYWSWIEALVEPVLSTSAPVATQPLLLTDERSIASAGAAVLDGRLRGTSVLEGLAADEARWATTADLPALEGVVAVRSSVARQMTIDGRSGDDALPDLTLRGHLTRGVSNRCVPGARLVRSGSPDGVGHGAWVSAEPTSARDAWSGAGLRPVTDGRGRVERLVAVRPASIHAGIPALRWTIDTPVTDGPWGDHWGDLHFAEALAEGLRGWGQHVCVDRKESRTRATRDLDDVVVVLRGRDVVVPSWAATSVLWVISHPSTVRADEAERYDLVLGASTAWVAGLADRVSVPVHPLLQATAASRFHQAAGQPGAGPDLLFVGNARGAPRPVVAAALAAGLRPRVHGLGWEGLIPDELLTGEYVPNEALGPLYASAGIVLNDHWADMARHCFVSNRVYDALACGAPVISDVVPEDPILASSVCRWSSAADLERIVRNRDQVFPDLAERRAVAAQVREHHSFDARAHQLIELVLSRTPADRG